MHEKLNFRTQKSHKHVPKEQRKPRQARPTAAPALPEKKEAEKGNNIALI